jgi:hypothetical protein
VKAMLNTWHGISTQTVVRIVRGQTEEVRILCI